jgi:hypothetical protein
MPKLMQYRVVREHQADKAYREGDTREAVEGEVSHLVPHVLELIGPAPSKSEATEPEAKSEPAPQNKAEPEPTNKAETAAPAKKAASPRKSKRK